MNAPVIVRISLAPIIGLALAMGTGAPARADEFLRGDANLDGAVTLADAYWLDVARLRAGNERTCASAGDANDDGKVNVADGIWVLNYLYRSGPEIPAPFPSAGSDPSPDALTCASAARVDPIDDPAAVLEVLEASVLPGAEHAARVTIAMRGSRAIAGYAGALRLPEGLAAYGSLDSSSLTKSWDPHEFFGTAVDGATGIRFGYLLSSQSYLPLDAAEATRTLGDVRVVEVRCCLAPGLAAGDYPLELEQGELVDADTGRAIPCTLAGGVLHVEDAVPSGAACGQEPPPVDPGTIDVAYRLGSVSAAPGAQASVPFSIHSNAGVQGYSFSIDFDETRLRLAEVVRAWARPDGKDYGYMKVDIDNEDASPGGEGVDEGFTVGAVVFDFTLPLSMPAGAETTALDLRFEVKPGASGAAAVRFQDGGRGTGRPVVNSITAFGENFEPEQLHSFVFIDGVFHILPDITLFVRGDSNDDSRVNIADAVATLDYLFLGDLELRCLDAADADDDGRVDIADPIFTLGYLFQGSRGPAQPFPSPGVDPTPDELTCSPAP